MAERQQAAALQVLPFYASRVAERQQAAALQVLAFYASCVAETGTSPVSTGFFVIVETPLRGVSQGEELILAWPSGGKPPLYRVIQALSRSIRPCMDFNPY